MSVKKIKESKKRVGRKVVQSGVKTKVPAGYRGADKGKKNMTGQIRARFQLLDHNLKLQQKEVLYMEKFVGRLPNALQMVEAGKRRVAKTKLDIKNLKTRALKLQREGKIEKVF